MSKRKIIKINETLCDGCGLCIPDCPEGAIRIINGKAKIDSEFLCDGLGACLGRCPRKAITIEEREAADYDEAKVISGIAKQGGAAIKKHLAHLKEHNQQKYIDEAVEYLEKAKIKIPEAFTARAGSAVCGCPGSRSRSLGETSGSESELRQWPVQITLANPGAPYFKNAGLLVSADCVPFAYRNFHEDFLKGKILLVGCPKLDDLEAYAVKFRDIISNNGIKSITYVRMEVPCCAGLSGVLKSAIAESGKKIPYSEVVVGINGKIKPA
jgi:NAD-dependent dihydropyrimidine dehydrogenase PreA subunit